MHIVIIHNFECKTINLNNYNNLGIIVNVRFKDQLRNSLMTPVLTDIGVFLKLGFGVLEDIYSKIKGKSLRSHLGGWRIF